jgi:hypothetical protein
MAIPALLAWLIEEAATVILPKVVSAAQEHVASGNHDLAHQAMSAGLAVVGEVLNQTGTKVAAAAASGSSQGVEQTIKQGVTSGATQAVEGAIAGLGGATVETAGRA